MHLVFKAPPSVFLNVLSVLILKLSALSGLSELRGKNLPYSKFFNVSNPKNTHNRYNLAIPSRTAMFICYSPAFVASLASFFVVPNPHQSICVRMLLLRSALLLHFLKRVFEVLFVHKYSGNMAIGTAIFISISYVSSTSSLVYAQYLSQGLEEPTIDLKYVGVLLFLIGINGNLYHHYLLSQLRDEKSGVLKEYKIPKGGLFNLIICPHYLLEIIVFVGLSFISQTYHSFCIAIGTMMYLVGRSFATRRWYLFKFEDFPIGVKAIIPFVL